jgi:ribosomal protein S12 methylthiotransferase
MDNLQKKEISVEEIKNKKIGFISLGCDKNKVDLEEMMNDLSSFGFTFSDVENAQIVIINTCAFILSARKEAINNILEMVKLKDNGILEKIVVTGCLSQRYLEELQKAIPEVDQFVQIKDNKQIVEIISNLYDKQVKFNSENQQLAILPNHYAYLKIADGCNNCCSYCTIPRIRGRYISKPFNEIISRAKQLVAQGVKELIIVAQDKTRYGLDLYNEYRLVKLLTELTKIKNLKWIRLHYCYPELVSDELLEY